MTARLVPALLAAAALCGCRPPAPGAAAGPETSGSRTWVMPAGGVPGLDGGSVYFIGTRFVVWAGDGRGGGGGSTSSGRDGAEGDGHVVLNAGHRIDFRFALPAGKPGTATVAGTEYDLTQGRLILIKPDGDRLVVRQVDADLSGLRPGTDDLAAFGRATPAVRAFFDPPK